MVNTLMYKIIILFLIAMSTAIAATDTAQRKDPNWEKIVYWKGKGTEAYVDRNSIRHDEDMTFGIILLKLKTPTMVSNGAGKNVLVTIISRYVIIDCKASVIAPIIDFHFNIPGLPKLSDIPLGAIDYSDAKGTVVPIPKSEPIYMALCPSYV
jgi:hypothetical protein